MRSYGHLTFTWSNDTLYVRAFGPFNEEGAANAANAYLSAIKDRSSTAFSVIEILDAESLGSEETLAEVGKLWNHLTDQGCIALAIVYHNKVQRSVARKYIPKYGNIFSTLKDAEAWVSENK